MPVKKARKRGFYVEKHEGVNRIHSPYDPVGEAEKIPIPSQQADKYLIFGAGLGYIMDRLGKINPGSQLLIIEPFPELLKEGGRRGIWSPDDFKSVQIIDRNVKDILGALGEFIPDKDSTSYEVIRWRDYQQKTPQFFSRAIKSLEQLQKYHRVNLQTLHQNGQQWLGNFRHNLSKIQDHKNINFGANTGNIAVVGAGPSLDKQIGWLEANRESLTIICVNTAGPVLKKRGIKADLHAAADCKEVVGEDLDHSPVSNLLAGPYLAPKVVGKDNVNFSLLALQSQFTAWLNEAPFCTEATSAGSVTVTVLDMLLRNCGGNIYLLGGDMEFKGERYYARGTWREEKLLQRTNRFCSYLQAFLQWQHEAKNRQQEENPRLEDERNWLQKQGTQKDRLLIPSPTPSWWKGATAPEKIKNKSQKITLEPVKTAIITEWFKKQHNQFCRARKDGKSRPEWNNFIYWIDEVCQTPEEELNKWDELLTKLAGND